VPVVYRSRASLMASCPGRGILIGMDNTDLIGIMRLAQVSRLTLLFISMFRFLGSSLHGSHRQVYLPATRVRRPQSSLTSQENMNTSPPFWIRPSSAFFCLSPVAFAFCPPFLLFYCSLPLSSSQKSFLHSPLLPSSVCHFFFVFFYSPLFFYFFFFPFC